MGGLKSRSFLPPTVRMLAQLSINDYETTCVIVTKSFDGVEYLCKLH